MRVCASLKPYAEGVLFPFRAEGATKFLKNGYFRAFKVTTRYYKGIDQWLSYVGFPDTSLERWCEGRQVDKFDDKKLLLHLTAEEQKHVADVFTEWKQQQVATAKAQAAEGEAQNGGVRKIGKMVSREKQVLMRLQAFPLERSSPLECMTFLSELKNMLQTDAADFPQTNETAYGSE
jgi:hypothetical protein